MKRILIPAALMLLSPAFLQADQTINYPDKDPIFSISFPDSWTVEQEDQSVSASSKDEMVNMELLALDAEALSEAVEIAKESLEEEFEGLKFSELEKGELNGMSMIFLNAQAKVEGVKMAVNCCIFAPKGADTFFMLFNVTPMEMLEKHEKAISKIMNSIKGE